MSVKTEKHFWGQAFTWLMEREDDRGIYCSSVYQWNPHYKIIRFWMRGQDWKLYQPYPDTGLGPVLLNTITGKWKELPTVAGFKRYLKDQIKKP